MQEIAQECSVSGRELRQHPLLKWDIQFLREFAVSIAFAIRLSLVIPQLLRYAAPLLHQDRMLLVRVLEVCSGLMLCRSSHQLRRLVVLLLLVVVVVVVVVVAVAVVVIVTTIVVHLRLWLGLWSWLWLLLWLWLWLWLRLWVWL